MTGTNPTPRLWLGTLDYMSLAYTCVPCLYALSISFLLRPSGADSAFGGFIKGRAADALRLGGILLFWMLVVLSGTRGAVLSVIAFYLLFLLYQSLRRKPVGKILAVMSGLAAAFLIMNTVVKTPAMEMTRQRYGIVLDGLKKGRLTAEPEAQAVMENIDNLVKLSGRKSFRKSVSQLPPDSPPALSALAGANGGVVRIANRGTLYVLAVKEFLKSPIYGMFPLGFFVKYDNYPHNVFLEILSELGLLGFLPLMAVFVLLAVKLLKAAPKGPTAEAMLVLLVGLALMCMTSGTIWGELDLIFVCAYAAAFGRGFFRA